MKKILLASGDSFTDENFYSEFHPDLDCSWPKWPKIIADKLDMTCVNLGYSGAGNEYMYSQILDYITSIDDVNRIGMVMVGWSQVQRRDYQTGKHGRWTNSRRDRYFVDAVSLSNRSLRYYLSFQILCERFNLPYYHFQMINFASDMLSGLRYGHHEVKADPELKRKVLVYQGDKEADKIRIQSQILNYESRSNGIKPERFIGWPIDKSLGGYPIATSHGPILDTPDLRKKYYISNLDDHPNKEGQELIAEYIYDRMG